MKKKHQGFFGLLIIGALSIISSLFLSGEELNNENEVVATNTKPKKILRTIARFAPKS